jgi:hypothetical protein
VVHGSLSPVLNVGRGDRAVGSIEKRESLSKVSVDCDFIADRRAACPAYHIDGYRFSLAAPHYKPESQARAGSVTPDRVYVNDGIWKP